MRMCMYAHVLGPSRRDHMGYEKQQCDTLLCRAHERVVGRPVGRRRIGRARRAALFSKQKRTLKHAGQATVPSSPEPARRNRT